MPFCQHFLARYSEGLHHVCEGERSEVISLLRAMVQGFVSPLSNESPVLPLSVLHVQIPVFESEVFLLQVLKHYANQIKKEGERECF